MPLIVLCGPACAPLPAADCCEKEPETLPASEVRSSGTAPSRSENETTETPNPGTSESGAEPGAFVELELPDHPGALVWVPNEPERTLPLFVIAHGAGGAPDWHCDFWSRVVGAEAFLLCLRGLPIRAGANAFYFPEHHTLEALFERAVRAIDDQFGDHLRADESVYIAYSQGATMGAWMLPAHASRFSRALLIEGGVNEWNVRRAVAFRKAGGKAVFIACGTQVCNSKAGKVVEWFKTAGVAAKTAHASGAGHTPGGEVGVFAIQGLAWLLRQR
jgi:pimeloyl-ACP methyl ester carboxylesterase